MNPIKEKRRLLKVESEKFGAEFVELPVHSRHPQAPIRAWRNRYYLAQLYRDPSGNLRLSVNSTEIDSRGDWKDGIPWDVLQSIKSQIGFGDRMAVEIYPEDDHLVYDHNIRHLWILNQRLPFAWTRENAANDGSSDTGRIRLQIVP